MLTNIRKPTAPDLNYLLDIDLKCFENNWAYNVWRETLADPQYGVLIGTHEGLPVGFIVWHTETREGTIPRFGVKKTHRNRGVGSQLLSAVEVIMLQQGVGEVHLSVTESLCQPRTPGDISKWLINRDYIAHKLLKGAGFHCGETEDAVAFHKFLEGTNKHGS